MLYYASRFYPYFLIFDEDNNLIHEIVYEEYTDPETQMMSQNGQILMTPPEEVDILCEAAAIYDDENILLVLRGGSTDRYWNDEHFYYDNELYMLNYNKKEMQKMYNNNNSIEEVFLTNSGDILIVDERNILLLNFYDISKLN